MHSQQCDVSESKQQSGRQPTAIQRLHTVLQAEREQQNTRSRPDRLLQCTACPAQLDQLFVHFVGDLSESRSDVEHEQFEQQPAVQLDRTVEFVKQLGIAGIPVAKQRLSATRRWQLAVSVEHSERTVHDLDQRSTGVDQWRASKHLLSYERERQPTQGRQYANTQEDLVIGERSRIHRSTDRLGQPATHLVQHIAIQLQSGHFRPDLRSHLALLSVPVGQF